MNFYIRLQYRRLQRWLDQVGLPFSVAVVLAGGLFVFLSLYFFERFSAGGWAYAMLGLLMILQSAPPKKRQRLSLIFDRRTVARILITEALAMTLSFVLILLYKGFYLEALALPILASLLCLWAKRLSAQRVIPTPFRHHPFEFIVGFRSTLAAIFLGCFLMTMGMRVDNYNLAAVSSGFLYLIPVTYYFKLEPHRIVWQHRHSAEQFLNHKLITALRCQVMYALPILVVMLLSFSSHWLISCALWFTGVGFIATAVMAKYSSYPGEMHIPQGLILSLCLLVPPFLLVALYLFRRQSIRRLIPQLP